MPLLFVLLAAACAPCTVDDDRITVPYSTTPNDDGTYTSGVCYEEPVTNTFDYAPCCPDGYTFVALVSDGVLCADEACE